MGMRVFIIVADVVCKCFTEKCTLSGKVAPPRGDRPIGLSVKKPSLNKSTPKTTRPKPARHTHQAVPVFHPNFTNRLNKPVPVRL